MEAVQAAETTDPLLMLPQHTYTYSLSQNIH